MSSRRKVWFYQGPLLRCWQGLVASSHLSSRVSCTRRALQWRTWESQGTSCPWQSFQWALDTWLLYLGNQQTLLRQASASSRIDWCTTCGSFSSSSCRRRPLHPKTWCFPLSKESFWTPSASIVHSLTPRALKRKLCECQCSLKISLEAHCARSHWRVPVVEEAPALRREVECKTPSWLTSSALQSDCWQTFPVEGSGLSG